MADDALWEKICVVDTENESGSLYVGTSIGGRRIGGYLTINLQAPFTPQRYTEAIDVAENAGVEFLIIDSLSHAWTGAGGMLEQQGAIANRSGNSYTAWREITPQHNKLVDKILQCPMHVLVSMRTKTEYAIEENDKGKKAPKKIGMAPVFRDGIEYEVTVFFELAQDHSASATKDRTGIFDHQYLTISPETGKKLYEWLASGEPATEPAPTIQKAPEPDAEKPIAQLVDEAIQRYCAGMGKLEKEQVAGQIKEITGGVANYRQVTDEDTLRRIYEHFVKEDA